MDVETFLSKIPLASKEINKNLYDFLSRKFCQEMIIHAIKNNNMKYAEILKNVIFSPHIQTLENALKNGEDEEIIKKVIFFHGPSLIVHDMIKSNYNHLIDLFFKQKWCNEMPIFEYLVQYGKNKYVRQYLDTFGVGPPTVKGLITGKVSYIEIDRLVKEALCPCTRRILLSYLPWAPIRYWQELTTDFFND